MTPEVSILVPVYNRHDDLCRLLDDLRQQSFRDFEVVVVDDGSSPPISGVIAQSAWPFPFNLVVNDKTRGIGYSRNRAVEAARGRLLVWVDSDSRVPDPKWLAGHVERHQVGHPALGIAPDVPFVLHSRVDGATPTYAGRTFMYSNWFASCQPRARRVRKHHVPTNNTSGLKELWESVGPFDSRFEAAEDIDWGLRALSLAIPIVYVPEMPVTHRDRETFSEVWRSFRNMGRFAQMVRLKHPAAPYSWLYSRNVALAWLGVIPLSVLITVYITACWLTRDLKVLWYVPGMYAANLAYSLGTVDGLRANRAG